MTVPYIAAFHGGGLSHVDLRRDMDNPRWLNWCSPSLDVNKVLARLPPLQPLVLVGYSSGGRLIGELSQYLPNLIGAVLYESPLNGIQPYGDFPVLWIRNDYRTMAYREREFHSAMRTWATGRDMTRMIGRGRHIRWRWGWPPIAHAWDHSLNPAIAAWIADLQIASNEPTKNDAMKCQRWYCRVCR